MKKLRLCETFSGDATMVVKDCNSICEADGNLTSLIDGINVIGMVEGQFFQPDGMSRNKRWYPRSLWENVLASADVKNRLLNHTMFGEIGHSDGPVTDMTLRSGEASHIIADLWIDEKGRGMGRAYILGTETGRRLKIYLGAKAKLKVSTRGEGVYLDGETHDGCPVIDPNSYELQTVDFVLNPGFLETSANLTAQRESVEQTPKKVNETIAHASKEGEEIMTLDMEKYVQKLEAKIEALEAKNETLSEELKSKEKELLQSQFVESAEMKKVNEAYAPFKKMGVTAEQITETLKRSQESLKKANAKNAKLTEELQAFKDACGGSIENIEEATKMSEKALDTISEYQKLGSVNDLKALMAKSEALLPQLEELKALKEYRQLGSIEDLKSLAEKCEKSLPKLRELKVLEDYKALGTVEDIKSLASKCESVLPKLEQLEDAKKLALTVKKVMPKLEKYSQLEKMANKAQAVIEQYLNTVGSINKAKALVESRTETIKKVNVKEALDLSKKYGSTIESAAKLIKKYGTEKASELLESAVAAKKSKPAVKLTESKKLVEEAEKIEKVNAKPETKTAHDFIKSGMVVNGFNKDALGKPMKLDDLNKVDGEKVDGVNAAKALLDKLKGINAEVEKAPTGLEKEKTAAEAEKEAKKLIK